MDSSLVKVGAELWIPDEEQGWLAGTVTKVIDANTIEFMGVDGKGRTWKYGGKGGLPSVRNTTLNEDRLDDLVRLSYLNQPTVMNTIKTRYMEDTIYTYSGLVLVSVNPYKDLGLYKEDLMETYSGARALSDLPPHVFAVASSSLHSLRATRRSQSIVVSGESGAGKTENARHIMRFFTRAAMSAGHTAAHREGIEEAVLATSPVLEAFGNAKTIRNDNSSRFGKYMQVLFDQYGGIVGAEIQTYLLEKTRVVFQSKNERSYHVFYFLCAAAQAGNAALKGMDIKGWQEYAFIRAGDCGRLARFDDAAEFEALQGAMERSGIPAEEQLDVWKVLYAILCIGNIEKPDPNHPYLKRVCDMLQMSADKFAHYLKFKKLVMGRETIEKELNDAQFINNRDALAKHMYELLFDWILSKINTALAPPSNVSRDDLRFIGVLDIYGFERMEKNSFEQFCINYANEKLQSEFCEKVFKVEQATYEREGITWSTIDFTDNQPCIDIIESRQGIIGLLDDECKVPNGSDKNLCEKLVKLSNQYISAVRFKQENFLIKHYAYDVEYASDGFLEKNRDQVSIDLLTIVAGAGDAFTKSLMSTSSHITTPNRQSTAMSFKGSLSALMDMIRSTDTHYVRCIKPNEVKKPLTFDAPHVLQQLQACGILETIRISAAGYPGRWSFKEFATRYCTMLSDIPENEQEVCRAVLARAKIATGTFQFGKTKLFFRAGVVIKLEEARMEILKASAIVIQAFGKLSCAQKWVDQCYVAAAVLQLVGAYKLDRMRAKRYMESVANQRISAYFRLQVDLARSRRLAAAAACVKQYSAFRLCQSGLVPRLKITGASRTIAGVCQGVVQIRKAAAEISEMRKSAKAAARRGSVDMEKKVLSLDSALEGMTAKAGSLEEQLEAEGRAKGALESALSGKEGMLSVLEKEKQDLEKKLMELQQKLLQIDPHYRSPTGSLTTGLSPKPRRPRPSVPMTEESKRSLNDLISSPLLQTELEEVVRAAIPPQVGQPQPAEDELLLPGRVMQRWLLVSMTVDVPGRDPESCLAQMDALLRLVKKILAAQRPMDSGQCAYWLANLTLVISGLHYFTTSATPEEAGALVGKTSEAMTASFGNVAWAVPVITARERIVRFVEEILGLWLTDLYGKMGGALRTAILEHQGLNDARAPSPSQSPGPAAIAGASPSSKGGSSLLNLVLWGSSATEEKPTLDSVLTRLQNIVEAMLISGLSQDLTTKIVECLLQHVAIGCFNQIMLRKSYATWKRGIQIQYNLTRLEEFLTAMSIPTAKAFAFFDPVMQVSRLLQIAKTAVDDPDSLKETCPTLSILQIRRVLTAYQPDRYDDGPVNPQLLQAIDAQIEEQQGGIPQGDVGVLVEASGVHFDIAAPPKPPVPASQFPSTLPANLYKFFMLTQDTL